MNILMMTNTYLPHVGGVARSVETLSASLRDLGHAVLIVAPEFPDHNPEDDPDWVIRVPAIQNFNGSDFSVRLPVPFALNEHIRTFEPDIIHTHHPFLLGDTAIRKASEFQIPVVFTHHTMYERYTHYVPLDSDTMKQLAKDLSTHFADMCDGIIAPSESIRDIIAERGVETPIRVIPTGIDKNRFTHMDGKTLRKELRIPQSHTVFGHVGRFAEEKNLTYLLHAACKTLKEHPKAHLLMVGDGDSRKDLEEMIKCQRLRGRVRFLGTLSGDDLVEAYKAMDIFIFASHTETQGMVVAEAMMAGIPVVALDAPGVREVVRDQENGLLLDAGASEQDFHQALSRMVEQHHRAVWKNQARKTALGVEKTVTAEACVDFYNDILRQFNTDSKDETRWPSLLGRIEAEWSLLQEKAKTLSLALQNT